MRGISVGFFFLLGIIVFFIAGLSGVFEQYQDTALSEWPSHVLALFMGGAVCYLVFWLWMIVDFFRRTHLRHKLCWGVGLFFTHILTAIPYFLFIYLPWARKPVVHRLPPGSDWRRRPTGFVVFSAFFFLSGISAFLGVVMAPPSAPLPLLHKVIFLVYAVSQVAFAVGLWRVSGWVVKASLFWFCSMTATMAIVSFYHLYVSFPEFFMVFIFFGGFAGLVVWYVSRTMRARAEAAIRNA